MYDMLDIINYILYAVFTHISRYKYMYVSMYMYIYICIMIFKITRTYQYTSICTCTYKHAETHTYTCCTLIIMRTSKKLRFFNSASFHLNPLRLDSAAAPAVGSEGRSQVCSHHPLKAGGEA